MSPRSISVSLFWAIFSVLVGCTLATIKIDAAGDAKFSEFFQDKIAHYGEWIQSKHEDPSTPIPDKVTLERHWGQDLELTCTIKDQVVSGHSTTTNDDQVAGMQFDNHYLVVGRTVNSPYVLQGTYECSGVLYRSGDLPQDVPFKGQGRFTMQINYSIEIIEFSNFGITEKYAFNKTNSWQEYDFFVYHSPSNLMGTWDSDIVEKYISLVQGGFSSVYWKFLIGNNLPQGHLIPSRKLFENFVDEIITTTNLTVILTKDELPGPYFPTSTTTTSTTTAKSTSNGYSDTTPTNTSQPSGSTSLSSSQIWLICAVTGFVIKNKNY